MLITQNSKLQQNIKEAMIASKKTNRMEKRPGAQLMPCKGVYFLPTDGELEGMQREPQRQTLLNHNLPHQHLIDKQRPFRNPHSWLQLQVLDGPLLQLQPYDQSLIILP